MERCFCKHLSPSGRPTAREMNLSSTRETKIDFNYSGLYPHSEGGEVEGGPIEWIC